MVDINKNDINRINRICIAAPRSGSGKTLVTCGLIRVLEDRGLAVQCYKAGPDYIDPMFHDATMRHGRHHCENLDTYFSDYDEIGGIFTRTSEGTHISIIEGVMGLYDGLGGTEPEGSTYDLASCLNAPIILVVDAKGASRSLVAEIRGFLDYDNQGLIKGVILNRCSKGMYDKLKEIMSTQLGIKPLGFLPILGDVNFESRYLGLMLPNEIVDINEQIDSLAKHLVESVDIDGILEMAAREGKAGLNEDVDINEKACVKTAMDTMEETNSEESEFNISYSIGKQLVPLSVSVEETKHLHLAVAIDEAFCFYYQENFRELMRAGFELVFFSPLRDKCLPESVAGVYIGGGYPELHAKMLSDNTGMLVDIKQKIGSKMPVFAECGGFMYLTKAIWAGVDGMTDFSMCDIFDTACSKKERLVRFGYVEITDETGIWLDEGCSIKGHEFHYYDSTDNGDMAVVRKASSGQTYSEIHITDTIWAGWPHLYLGSSGCFAENFYNKCLRYMNACAN